MNTINNHQNMEICPRCGNWTRNPKDYLCPTCYEYSKTFGIETINIRTMGKRTLSDLRDKLRRLETHRDTIQDQLWLAAREKVMQKIANEALLCQRPKSDLDNCEEEVEAMFEQFLKEDTENQKTFRAVGGIKWAIKSLEKFLAGLEQKNKKAVVVV